MGEYLQKLLNEVVVTPYDTEITSRLSEICNDYAKEVTIRTIDEYIASFVFNKPNMDFKKEVEIKYSEQYPNEKAIMLPPLFAIVLSQYIVIEAITQYLEGQDQATASLILMNYMLYRKGSLVSLILPDHIKQMYSKMDDYITQKDDIAIDGNFNYLKAILSDRAYLDTHYHEAELKTEVRKMAKISYLYKRQSIIDKYKNYWAEISYAKVSVSKPYAKVYEFLTNLLNQTDWLLINNDVVSILTQVVSEEGQKKSTTIESIVNELRGENVKIPYDIPQKSSLLLRYVSGKDQTPIEIKNRRLTVMEFGIYIYYELLLEHINHNYYDGRGE